MERKNKLITSAVSNLIKGMATKNDEGLALPADLKAQWDSYPNISLSDLKGIWYHSGILTSSQVMDTLHDAIAMNDDVTSNSIDADQAQMIERVSQSQGDFDQQLFWDENDIFDDETKPLTNKQVHNRL